MRLKASGRRAKVGLVALLATLAALSLLSIRTAEANTGCPDSTSNLGDIILSGTCTISLDTTWENGTITIAGDIIVNPGVSLTLENVSIRFSPGFDGEFGIHVSGTLSMLGGGVQSTNANHWSLSTALGSTISIEGSDFANGQYDFYASVADVGYSTFRDSDMTSIGPLLWVGAESRFHHNVVRDISLSQGAAIIVYKNWGDLSIWGNELHLNCYGSNCMGIEVINMQEEETDVYPGFPVVEIAWNNVTWEDIGPGGWAISFDNEFSSRLYIHNNTQYVNDTGEMAGNCLQGGGVRRGSIYENNTCYGPAVYGIYNYIYENAGNTFQHNHFEDVIHGAIFQTGGSVVRYNTFGNVSEEMIILCPNAPCAGSTANTANMEIYGNTADFEPGSYIVRVSPSNMFDNAFIGHGNGQAAQWTEGSSGPYHTVYGEGNWLYWANDDIAKLQFVNSIDGTRYVNMTVNGKIYDSRYEGFGTDNEASLTVEGSIDRIGSSNYDDSKSITALWSLDSQKTEIDVLGTGSMTFTVEDFFPDRNYSVAIWNYSSSVNEYQGFTTDGNGMGTFSASFTGQYNVTIELTGTLPPPPDETAPAQVTDLETVVVNSEYAILQWHAPGDDGSAGQAATYDIRYSTAGPLDGVNFDSATPVPVEVPSPATAGSTERLNVSGLSPGTEYWFALRTADEIPNWSPVSNSVNATTLLNETEVDDTPPSVTITSPSEGALVSGNVLIVMTVVDDTSVEEVKILIDGSPTTTLDEAPYEWSWPTVGVSSGSHIIRAEATDPTGNVGWDEISVEVSPQTPIIPEPVPPTVESISYNPTEGRFDIQFSKPMDRTSAREALHIEPQIPYTTSWTDDSSITVVLQDAAQADTTYVLTINQTAADSEGITLAEAFTFSFSGVDPGGGTLTTSNLWLQIVMLLGAAWVVVVGLLFWSRRGIKRLRLNVRQLATQIEELNTRPATPGQIEVYHRY